MIRLNNNLVITPPNLIKFCVRLVKLWRAGIHAGGLELTFADVHDIKTSSQKLIPSPRFLPPGYSFFSCFSVFSSMWRNPEFGVGDNFGVPKQHIVHRSNVQIETFMATFSKSDSRGISRSDRCCCAGVQVVVGEYNIT